MMDMGTITLQQVAETVLTYFLFTAAIPNLFLLKARALDFQKSSPDKLKNYSFIFIISHLIKLKDNAL